MTQTGSILRIAAAAMLFGTAVWLLLARQQKRLAVAFEDGSDARAILQLVMALRRRYVALVAACIAALGPVALSISGTKRAFEPENRFESLAVIFVFAAASVPVGLALGKSQYGAIQAALRADAQMADPRVTDLWVAGLKRKPRLLIAADGVIAVLLLVSVVAGWLPWNAALGMAAASALVGALAWLWYRRARSTL